MTKSEYREYIASEAWRERRRKFLRFRAACWRCGIPRWLAVIIYDQDLHVHHKSYARVGAELDSDLEQLCARCHELETFGKSSLVDATPPLEDPFVCKLCGDPNPWPERQGQYPGRWVSEICGACDLMISWQSVMKTVALPGEDSQERWRAVLSNIFLVVGFEAVLSELAEIEKLYKSSAEAVDAA